MKINFTINIEKKHFIILVTLLLLILLVLLSVSLSEVNTSKAYHYMQQIAFGPNDGNINENVSIDSNGDGVLIMQKMQILLMDYMLLI